MIRKVVAYVTKNDKLLVLSHPYSPEVGLQVPSGTVNEGELLEDAVIREVFEETGLKDVRITSYMGNSRFSSSSENRGRQCFYFHLICNQETPSRWRIEEKDPSVISEGDEYPLIFELYWISIREGMIKLPPYYGKFLRKLHRI
ncbi:MAG: NUDIX domain-containing protein [Candidatus Heimdallarchaeota archaeon]